MFKAKVNVTLRPSILDPKGKAAHHALQNLGLTNIKVFVLVNLLRQMFKRVTKKKQEALQNRPAVNYWQMK